MNTSPSENLEFVFYENNDGRPNVPEVKYAKKARNRDICGTWN